MRGVTAYVLACAAAAAVPWLVPAAAPPVVASFPGWPVEFEGAPLSPLPLSAREQVFLAGFPGRVGRFTDGARELVIRYVQAPTRMLHPSAECLRATGYGVDEGRLHRGADGGWWSVHVAAGPAGTVRFREQVRDASGRSWSDVSSWYWDAALARTTGPWWAFTVADP